MKSEFSSCCVSLLILCILVLEIACKDTFRNPADTCTCGTHAEPESAFNMAKTNFGGCLKQCKLCLTGSRKDEETKENEEKGSASGDDVEEESGNDA